MIWQTTLKLPAKPQGIHDITPFITAQSANFPDAGILHLFLKHTSAGILITENADPSVRHDLQLWMNALAPENQSYYTHTFEGPDDMPAHMKSLITGVSLTIPIKNKHLELGVWQGIFLAEFRNHAKSREISLSIYS